MNRHIRFAGTFILAALSLIMLCTHTWIFGAVGAVYCVWRALVCADAKASALKKDVMTKM